MDSGRAWRIGIGRWDQWTNTMRMGSNRQARRTGYMEGTCERLGNRASGWPFITEDNFYKIGCLRRALDVRHNYVQWTFNVRTTLPSTVEKINIMYSTLIPSYLKYCGCLQPLSITIDFYLPLSFPFHPTVFQWRGSIYPKS